MESTLGHKMPPAKSYQKWLTSEIRMVGQFSLRLQALGRVPQQTVHRTPQRAALLLWSDLQEHLSSEQAKLKAPGTIEGHEDTRDRGEGVGV